MEYPMTEPRFDSVVQSLTDNWEFELLVSFYEKHAISHKKHLEFCVLLADLGLLENLHKFIASNGLYKLRALVDDPATTYIKSGNARILLDIYEADMLPSFERKPAKSDGIADNLFNLALYEDASIIENYLSTNKDKIFHNEQNPKTLMYLTFALNQLRLKTSDTSIDKIVLNNFSSFKNLSAIRRAYITKKISMSAITCEKTITFPQLGYNELQKLLGIIAAQKTKYLGAARAYSLVSDVVRTQLKKPAPTKIIGWGTKPRVAVCMSGVYRSGDLAIESIYKNIIKPLEADIFFHSWTEMQDWPGLGGAGDEWLIRTFNKEIFNKCPIPIRSKKFFKAKFPNTFARLDTPSKSDFFIEKLPPEVQITNSLIENDETVFQKNGLDITKYLSMGAPNQAKMIYGIYKAHELAAEYEKEKGFRYDYVIRCRPDVSLQNQLDFSDLEKLKSEEIAMEFSKEWGPQDQFWYGQRSSAFTMASLWAASIDSNSLSPFPLIPQMRAHNLILGWMTENHLQPIHTPIKRNMNMVNSQASPPYFTADLMEDLTKEAKEFSQNQQARDFFVALQEFNKK